MAKTIEPISSWQNGEEKQATLFDLTSIYDNLQTTASFQYFLNEINKEVGYSMYNTLVSGNLNLTGQDYIDWDISTNANEWVYNWAANKLNLTITGDYVPPVPPIIEEPIVEEVITEPIIAK